MLVCADLETEAAEPELQRRIPGGGDVEEGELPVLLAGAPYVPDLLRLEVVRLEGEQLQRLRLPRRPLPAERLCLMLHHFPYVTCMKDRCQNPD
jgi:hypothetical protein